MTAPQTSTIPAAKHQLVAALQARAGLDGVTVLYAWNGVTLPPEQRQEWIFLDPPDSPLTTTNGVPVMSQGRRVRDEQYPIIIAIRVEHADEETGETVELRVYEILAEIEDMFATSENLAGTIGSAGRVTVGTHTRLLWFAEDRWKAQIVVQLACKTRLS